MLTKDRKDFALETVAEQYELLWMLEAIFRTMKSALDTRSVYHQVDETIRVSVFRGFLAILLKREL